MINFFVRAAGENNSMEDMPELIVVEDDGDEEEEEGDPTVLLWGGMYHSPL